MCHPAISFVTFVHSGLSAVPFLPTVAQSWERFRLQILKLSIEQQVALCAWLIEAIDQPQAEISDPSDIPLHSGRSIVESRQIGKVTYRLELVKCGKLGCCCAIGQLHGPYWYAYQKQQGKLKSWYVGKTLSAPDD